MTCYLSISHWGLIAYDLDLCNPRIRPPQGWFTHPTQWGSFVTHFGEIPVHFA